MSSVEPRASLATVLREWGRIGCIGFGGPPTHISLLRELCVDRRRWLDDKAFEDAVAACNLLPGPASTQLAIFCAWHVRGRLGAVVGGVAFIVPGLVVILALAWLFLAGEPPLWVRGAGAGAGGAVAAVAVHAGVGLLPSSWRRAADARGSAGGGRSLRSRGAPGAGAVRPRRFAPRIGRCRPEARTLRWGSYLAAGLAAAALLGPWLVLVLLACGAVEAVAQRAPAGRAERSVPALAAAGLGGGVLASLAWVAFKVGALSYGGGFVIIPLMRADAVDNYGWMSDAEFLNAVALGQITPGPVVQTVAVVGFAAAGLGGGVLASAVAFSPSFAFVLLGAHRFDQLRGNVRVRAFLDGAGPAAIGAIFGSAVPLALALSHAWQYAVLAGAAVLLLALRRGVVLTLLCAAAVGVVVALAGGAGLV